MASTDGSECYIDDLVSFEQRCELARATVPFTQPADREAKSDCTSYIDDLDVFSQRVNCTTLTASPGKSAKEELVKISAGGTQHTAHHRRSEEADKAAHNEKRISIEKKQQSRAHRDGNVDVFIPRIPNLAQANQIPPNLVKRQVVRNGAYSKPSEDVVLVRKLVKRVSRAIFE